MRKMIDSCFEMIGSKPRILIETRMNHVLEKLVSDGACCTIIPRSLTHVDENICWFLLELDPRWEVAMVYNPNYFQSKASKRFLELAQNYGHEVEKTFPKLE